MEDKATMRIRKPRSDDKPMWDILFGVWGLPAVFVAHDLKLFSLLAERPLTLQEVCNAKGLKRRPAEALLSVVTSLGLMRLTEGRYALTPVAEDYFVEGGVAYFGGLLDLTVNNYPLWSIESLKKAVLTDSAQAYGGGDSGWYRSLTHRNHPRSSRAAKRDRAIALTIGGDSTTYHGVLLDARPSGTESSDGGASAAAADHVELTLRLSRTKT